MGVGEKNQAPNSGNEFNGGSYQNQPQTRSTLHPQHQQPEVFPPYQESHDYDDNQPAAFPPPPEKAHAFPPPQADQQTPASFPPNEQQQFNNQHGQGFHQPAGFNAQMVGGSPMHGIPFNNNPAFQPAPMPMPVHQPPMQFNATQPWNSSLLDCFDDPENALITVCFPCVTFGQIAEIVDQGQSSCGSSGCLYTLIACCIAMPCLLSCTYRGKMRGKFGLIESPGPDWIIHCFCECCALCQEYRELKKRGYDPSIGWAGNAARMGRQNGGVAMMTPPVQPMMGR